MTRTEVIDMLKEIRSYTSNLLKVKALDYAIVELKKENN